MTAQKLSIVILGMLLGSTLLLLWACGSDEGKSTLNWSGIVAFGLLLVIVAVADRGDSIKPLLEGYRQAASDAETAKQQAEAEKVAADNAKANAEAEKVAAETAKANAEAEKVAADNAKANAEAEKVAADNAKANAEAEKVAADNAKATAVRERDQARRDRTAATDHCSRLVGCAEALQRALVVGGYVTPDQTMHQVNIDLGVVADDKKANILNELLQQLDSSYAAVNLGDLEK